MHDGPVEVMWNVLSNPFGILCGLALVSIGCSGTDLPQPTTGILKQPPSVGQSVPTAPSQPAPTKPEKAKAISLKSVDLPGYEAELVRHRGKVVLADFWATWCKPCREQFSHTIDLQNKYRDQGLIVLTISIDQMDEGESLDDLKVKVLDFLKERQCTLTNLLVPVTDLAPGDAGATDLIAERFDLDGGAVPHYKLYDRHGQLQKKFIVDPESGEVFKDRDVRTAIESLLNITTD